MRERLKQRRLSEEGRKEKKKKKKNATRRRSEQERMVIWEREITHRTITLGEQIQVVETRL